MCYSLQLWTDYRRYVQAFGAQADIGAFLALFERRLDGERIALPKGLCDAFKYDDKPDALVCACRQAVRAYDQRQAPRLEAELFAQRRRLADAERALAVKLTTTASTERRIAARKVDDLRARLADLDRTAPAPADARIFAGYYCPVLRCAADGALIVTPMRYQCRQPGMAPEADRRFPGTFSARRDSLRRFWRRQYGHTHAIVVAEAFYAHSKRHILERRALAQGESEETLVLEIAPADRQLMALACVWSHWRGPGAPTLDSFAVVTDQPARGVSVPGQVRCPVALRSAQVARWLAAPGASLETYDALLQEPLRPQYAFTEAV